MARSYNEAQKFLSTSLKQRLHLAPLFIVAGILDTVTTFYGLTYTNLVETSPFFVPFLTPLICLAVSVFCFYVAPKAKGGYVVAWVVTGVMLMFAFAPGISNLFLLL